MTKIPSICKNPDECREHEVCMGRNPSCEVQKCGLCGNPPDHALHGQGPGVHDFRLEGTFNNADRWRLEHLKPVEELIEKLKSVNAHFLLKVIGERAMTALWELDTPQSRKHLQSLTDAGLSFERTRASDASEA
jgi:hypothetical protein